MMRPRETTRRTGWMVALGATGLLVLTLSLLAITMP
jgi:hypothetical protein